MNNSIISCNWIRGSGAYSPSMNNSSITSFVLGNPVTINCNDIDNTYEGLVIHGPTNSNASSSLVGGNNFRNHFNALHLTSSAIIGQQIRTGNLWFNTPLTVLGTQGKNAIYDNVNNAAAFEIIVNPNTSIANADPEPDPIYVEPSGWITPDTTNLPNFECIVAQYCNQFNIASNNEGELDEEVMDESINNYPYTPETIWMLQSELYARLSRDSILLNSDSLYQAFYNNMQNDNIALFENVNEELQTAYDLDPAVYANLVQNNSNLNVLIDDLSAKMEQLNDESLSTEALASLQAEIASLQSSIQTLVEYNNNAIELAQTSQTLTVSNVEAVNNGIVSSETVELNEQEVNEIYLNTFAENVFEFSPAQENSLLSIANQCPMAGGPAVFKARALYAQIDPQQSFDDALLCLQQGILLREGKDDIHSAFKVYPNPTNNLLNIEYTIDTESKASISIYNTVGNFVLEKELDTKATNISYHLKSLIMVFTTTK